MGDLYTLCFTYLTYVNRKRGHVDQTRDYAERALVAATEQEMIHYIGTARANLAWVAWHAGDYAGGETHAQAALDLWERGNLPNYPFQWAARWPLIGVAYAQDRLCDAIAEARLIPGPTQQPLPKEQAAALEQAIHAWDAGQPEMARAHIEQAMALAHEGGYL